MVNLVRVLSGNWTPAPDVPDELDQVILRLLSKDPQARATNAMVSQGHLFFDDLASLEEKVQAAQNASFGTGSTVLQGSTFSCVRTN